MSISDSHIIIEDKDDKVYIDFTSLENVAKCIIFCASIISFPCSYLEMLICCADNIIISVLAPVPYRTCSLIPRPFHYFEKRGYNAIKNFFVVTCDYRIPGRQTDYMLSHNAYILNCKSCCS